MGETPRGVPQAFLENEVLQKRAISAARCRRNRKRARLQQTIPEGKARLKRGCSHERPVLTGVTAPARFFGFDARKIARVSVKRSFALTRIFGGSTPPKMQGSPKSSTRAKVRISELLSCVTGLKKFCISRAKLFQKVLDKERKKWYNYSCNEFSLQFGDIAQLGERLLRM